VQVEALAVMVAVTADFVFNRWHLEILWYYCIRHIPWCVRYHAQSLRLEALEYFYVGRGCCSPELYSIGPDWFEYICLVKMCLCQVSLLSRCSPRYLTSSV
jgi:hypothetical protein